MTDAQLAALNSGATSTLIGKITTNETAIGTINTTIGGYGNIVTHTTSTQGGKADTALQPNDNISELTNDAGYITGVTWNDVTGKPTTFTPSAHNQASNTINAMTGYSKPTSTSAIATSDTLNTAIGKLEKALDGKQATGSYVTTSRKINNKALSADITLTASDVGALPDSTVIPTITDTYSSTSSDGMSGKAVASALGSYVPTTRKVNNKVLSSDITLTASDVGAATTSHNQASNTINAMTGYDKSAGTATGIIATDTLNVALAKIEQVLDTKQGGGSYVSTSRKINNKELSSDITLTASDVGALPSSTVIPTITDTYSSTSSNGMSGKAVASAISNKADKATSLSGYGITDAYTKTEIDGKLSGAMHFKGTKASVSNLPTTGNVQGDMWNVTDTGANYAWDGSAWDKLSENIDLSGVVPTSRKINNKALTADITLSASDVGAAAISHNQASNTIDVMTGYSKPSSTSAISTSDTLNSAIGKLEKALDNKASTSLKATSSSLGLVKVDGSTITVDSAGTISAVQDTMTMVVDEFTMSSSGTQITLTNTPASKALCWVNICNTDIVSSEWSLSGNKITLSTAIPADTWGQVRYFTNVGSVTANSPLLKAKTSVSNGVLTLQASKKYYEVTVSGNTTFTITAPSTSDVIEFYLHITHTSGTITFPSSVKWASTPSFSTGKKHLIKMLSFDGGSTYLAQLEGSF